MVLIQVLISSQFRKLIFKFWIVLEEGLKAMFWTLVEVVEEVVQEPVADEVGINFLGPY